MRVSAWGFRGERGGGGTSMASVEKCPATPTYGPTLRGCTGAPVACLLKQSFLGQFWHECSGAGARVFGRLFERAVGRPVAISASSDSTCALPQARQFSACRGNSAPKANLPNACDTAASECLSVSGHLLRRLPVLEGAEVVRRGCNVPFLVLFERRPLRATAMRHRPHLPAEETLQ